MRKILGIFIILACLLCFMVQISAAEVINYTFDTEDVFKTVTNNLSAGGNAIIENGALKLNSSYGLDLGEADETFSVVAMVNVTSFSDFETVLFKNMGDSANQKWTGFKFEKGVPTVWTHGDGRSWSNVIVGEESIVSKWVHFAYIESNGKASLYLDGIKVGDGEVVKGKGHLYLGATFWSNDAIDGFIDNLVVFDTALTEKEVRAEHEKNIDYYIDVPSVAINDIALTKKVGTAEITWVSSDENVIKTDGTLVRGEEDKTVILEAFVGLEKVCEFEVLVLKKSKELNKDIILSYDFKKSDNGIIRDVSGNLKDGIIHNGLQFMPEGAVFDGKDDYIEMESGLFEKSDEVTIVTTFKPNGAQKHAYLYFFGNTTDTGYMFLNPSRPGTNLILFAATDTTGANERTIASLPGIRHNEWATVVMVIKGTKASMYIDGELVMDGDLGMKVSDLGRTSQNYIAKSLYDGDLHFAGTISEFTIYNYAMDEDKIKSLYKEDVIYASDIEKAMANIELRCDIKKAEYVEGKLKVIANADYKGGIAIISGYNSEGKLTNLVYKNISIRNGEEFEVSVDFQDAIAFKILYWGNAEK